MSHTVRVSASNEQATVFTLNPGDAVVVEVDGRQYAGVTTPDEDRPVEVVYWRDEDGEDNVTVTPPGVPLPPAPEPAPAPVDDSADGEPMRRTYLDLSTCVITEAESRIVSEAPVTVREDEYGWWVHVPPADYDEDQLAPDAEGWADLPNLRAVLAAARDRDAAWVRLDCDGFDTIPGLPTFDW